MTEEAAIKEYLEVRGIETACLEQMSLSDSTSIWHGLSEDNKTFWVMKNELFIDYMFNNTIGTFSEAAQSFSYYWQRTAEFLKFGNLSPCVNFEIPMNKKEKIEFSEKLNELATYIKSHFVYEDVLAS